MGTASARRLMARASSERGQATPFVVTVLIVLVLCLGLIVNAGQVINRRVALQVAADAGAFSGATLLASGLNALTPKNALAKRERDRVSAAIRSGSYFCTDIENMYNGWQNAANDANDLYRRLNDMARHNGRGENDITNRAWSVTRYNRDDLVPSTVMSAADRGALVPSEDPGTMFYMEQPSTSVSGRCKYWSWCGKYRCIKYRGVSKSFWWFSLSRTHKFTWVVTAEPARFWFVNQLLTANLSDRIPRMRAAAAADFVASGGGFNAGDASYRARMVKLGIGPW